MRSQPVYTFISYPILNRTLLLFNLLYNGFYTMRLQLVELWTLTPVRRVVKESVN